MSIPELTSTQHTTMTTDYKALFPLSHEDFTTFFPDACLETEFAFFEGCLSLSGLSIPEYVAYVTHLYTYEGHELVRDSPPEG